MNETQGSKHSVDRDGIRTVATDDGKRRFTRVELIASAALVIGAVLCFAPLASQFRRQAMPAEEGDEDGAPAPTSRVKDAQRIAAASRQAPEVALTGVDASSTAPALARKAVVPRRASEPPPVVSGRGQPKAAGGKKGEPEIDARDYIEALRAAGETGGIAAFPPPGTSPVQSGNVVPDDYVLPEGYVRHYQTTDDGEQLPAILMFSPDYDFYDQNGNPLQIPENGIVPPDMVPPDLPLRPLPLPKAPRR